MINKLKQGRKIEKIIKMEKTLNFIPTEFINNQNHQQEFSPDMILKMSPKELADFFSGLQNKLEKRFTSPELNLILSNLEAIQLTFGCSNGCPFCGVDAVPGVREHIPYSSLVNLFKKYGQFLKQCRPTLYYASEPSDYFSKAGVEDKTYEDVHQLAEYYADYGPAISSKKTSDKKWLEFLGVKEKAQVSVFSLSERKIKKLKKKLSKKVRLVGQGKSHRPGIGVSGSEKNNYRTNEVGIGCEHGVLLTPRGLYNLVQLPISRDFPQGQIVVPLEKISDTEIKEGDALNNVLRENIVKKTSVVSNLKFLTDSSAWQKLQICRKDGDYFIEFNQKGIITSCKKIPDQSVKYETK